MFHELALQVNAWLMTLQMQQSMFGSLKHLEDTLISGNLIPFPERHYCAVYFQFGFIYTINVSINSCGKLTRDIVKAPGN